ncbi:MAG: hypothetical protein KDK99_13195 [Verrucomicrobiales bacterium]|nr:hypothetical protein [Verrucomicrobiales bacterium]
MSQTRVFEILGRYDSAGDCHKLLYAPIHEPWTYRETRVYEVVFEGDAERMTSFVGEVLVDPISQESREGGASAFTDAAFVLEYGMKAGALDLEKEAILSYYRSLKAPGFELKSLTLRTRIYVFGAGADSKPFVRDVCNPAIHKWEVKAPAA